jgi:hypothetical protein
MMTGKGRRVVAATVVALIGALAACGATSTSSATSPPGPATSSASTQTSQGTATQTSIAADVRNLDPFLFPEQDTPLAQANNQLKGVWAPYQTTIIPSRHTLESMPEPRKVANLTVGAVKDTDAQTFLNAEYRDNTFVAWAEKSVQFDFLNKLQEDIYQSVPSYQAVKQGKAVSDPACDLYPVNPAVVVLDQQTKDYLTNVKHFTLRSPYAIVQTYEGPCDVTYASPPPGATPLGSLSAGGETDVIAGHLLHDPVLGDLWFADGSYSCATADAPKQICLAARA